MKLLLAASLLVFLEARSTPIQDKIRRILDFMQTVRGNGALAISTPTGLWPVEEINEKNIPFIFDFHDPLRKELAAAKAEAKAKGKSFVPESFSSDDEINLTRRESKQPVISAPRPLPSPPKSIPPFARGRLPPHSPPVHLSGYNAANSAAPQKPSFGGFFNPEIDSETSVDANAKSEKIAVEFKRSNPNGWSLPPSNIHVDPAPEFGDDIAIGIGPRGSH